MAIKVKYFIHCSDKLDICYECMLNAWSTEVLTNNGNDKG